MTPNYEGRSDRELILLTAQKMDWVANEFMDFRHKMEEQIAAAAKDRGTIWSVHRHLEKRVDGWQNKAAGASAIVSVGAIIAWEWIKRKLHILP